MAVVDLNIAAGRHFVDELKAKGGQAAFFSVDICSWEDSEKMVQHVLHEMGRIDILVHSAGITSRIPFEQLGWSEWKQTVSVNLTGLFHITKAVAPVMIEQQSGKIIIIGSASAISGSGGGVHYAASKGGAFGFMRALAKELGTYGINVNVIAPRVIESDMLNRLYPDKVDREALKNRIPIGRLGKLEDVSNMVRFLSSAESNYVHGQVMVLDGGQTFS